MGRKSNLPIEEKLAKIDQWRASGLKLKDYLKPLGEDLGMWVSWLRWERRWRGLDGALPAKPKKGQGAKSRDFVRAVPLAAGLAVGSVVAMEVVLRGSGSTGIEARVCWPAGQEQASARWLREVLQ